MNRAARMLAVLESAQRAFSREEIFERSGKHFLTNNAASELRSQGYDVVQSREPGPDGEMIYLYRLVGALPEAAVGAVSGRPSTTTSVRCLSPSLDAGPDTVADGTGRPSEFDRIAAEAHLEALLAGAGFELYRGEWDHLEEELCDQDLTDDLAEQQRVLFMEAA